nr:MAG TPA: hypothetical protein [Caudoviricetes sp.]
MNFSKQSSETALLKDIFATNRCLEMKNQD